MRKSLLWALIGGMVYFALEGLWRIQAGGWANVSMFLVGGLCFVSVGGINQIPAFFNLSMRAQAVIGTLVVLAVEYASGWLLNIRLGLGIWDYSSLPLNLHGQICAFFALLWFLLMPFAIWLEDWLRWAWYKIYGGEKPLWNYTFLQAYQEFFTGKRLPYTP